MAPKSSHRRDLAGSGRDVAVTPELGEPPSPEVAAAAPFFESFFFLDDILTCTVNSYGPRMSLFAHAGLLELLTLSREQ